MSRCCSPFSDHHRRLSPGVESDLRAIHVGFLLMVVFLCFPLRGNARPGSRWRLLGLAGMATAFYQWYFEADLDPAFR